MANTEVRQRAIKIAEMATLGTDPTPTAAFKTIGDGARISPIRTVVEDTGVTADVDGLAHQTFGSHNDVALEMFVVGKESAAGDSAVQKAIFHAAGFGETISASTSSTYALETAHTISGGIPPMAVYEEVYYTDGQMRRFKALDVYGNLTITAENDNYLRMTFEGMAPFVQAAALASGTKPTSYDGDKKPLLFRNATITIEGTSYCVTGWDYNTNWALEEERCATGASSLDSVTLVRGEGSREGGTLQFIDADLLDEILTAYGTDAEYTLVVECSDGTDTVTFNAEIQFGQYERNGGNLGSFAVPYFVVGTMSMVFT
jgi:hypothetical protein